MTCVGADVDRDPQRDAREGREREQVRPAAEAARPGRPAATRPPTAAATSRARAQVGQEVEPEHGEAGAPRREARRGAASASAPAATRRARRADDRRRLRRGAHGTAPRTTTTARSTWPFASTRSVYRPGAPAPEGCRVPGRAVPDRPPSVPRDPARLREREDREPASGSRHDAVPPQLEEADSHRARARARPEVPGDVPGDEPERVDALRQLLRAGVARPARRAARSRAELADRARPVDVQLDDRPLAQPVPDRGAVEAAVAVRRDHERSRREADDPWRSDVDPDRVGHHDRAPRPVEMDARPVCPLVDDVVVAVTTVPDVRHRRPAPAGADARARGRHRRSSRSRRPSRGRASAAGS